MSESQSDVRTVLLPKGLISPPLAPWQVFVLTFFTMTFYTSFWMYRSALDIGRIDSEKRQPILWFFSPLLGITLLGSIPRLLERYDVVLGVMRWTSKSGLISGLAFVGMLLLSLSGNFEVSFWLLLFPLALCSLAFALLQRATNDVKSGINPQHFTRKPFSFSVWHWITLLVMGTLIALITYALTMERLTTGPGEPVPANSSLQIPGSNMALKFVEPDWSRVNSGSYSDGSAIIELNGPSDYQWLIVFDQGKDIDIDDWIGTRRDAAEDPNNDGLSCKEQILTAANGVDFIADVTCTGKDMFGDPVLQAHRLRESKGHYWEAYGYLSAPKVTFGSYNEKLKRLVKSLQPEIDLSN